MHAFDAAKLHGSENRGAIRQSRRTLCRAKTAKATRFDPSKPGDRRFRRSRLLSRAIIGGADSAISYSTTRIVLESANFTRLQRFAKPRRN